MRVRVLDGALARSYASETDAIAEPPRSCVAVVVRGETVLHHADGGEWRRGPRPITRPGGRLGARLNTKVDLCDPEMHAEIRAEAARLERSVAWVVREAWRRARSQIREVQP